MLNFSKYLNESCDCWKNYKRKPGTKPCAPGSCVKEEVEIDEVKVWSSSHQKMMHHDEFPHTHTAKSDVHSSMSGNVIVKKGSKLSHLGNHNYLNISTGQHPIKLEPSSGSTHEALVKEGTVSEGERGLWDNIHAKRKRIKAGSGERMRKPGSKGAPTAAALKASQNEELSADEKFDLIEEFIEDLSLEHDIHSDLIWEDFESIDDEELYEAAVDAKGHKSSTGGLTQKGRDHYNSQSGGNLKAPVTTPPSELKAGSKAANRRKSFCARMGGMEGSMKKPNGEPTRKALALRKWNC